MIEPVAARLRSMLQEDPSRASCSLLITGHSAGGAVASLLYAHMLATDVKSELNMLTSCTSNPNSHPLPSANPTLLTNSTHIGFKRVHCITFGAPPISLLPLQKPQTRSLRKSLFLSFINEGDPVPRADKAYVRSLLDLYASPSPGSSCLNTFIPSCPVVAKITSGLNPTAQTQNQPASPVPMAANKTGFFPKQAKKRPKPFKSSSAPTTVPGVVWKVPPSTLSNAGRLVLLRSGSSTHSPSAKEKQKGGSDAEEDVRMCITSDEQLRGVVFGDPVMHMMRVYARRIEVLATRAVTARVWN